jgi:drug/metabolite transporter (DMT)-like permease
MRLLLLTTLTMLAFAANSVLNRMAVGPGLIGPVEFAVIRLLAGAVVLALLAQPWRRPVGGTAIDRAMGVIGLLVYLFGFSFAYLGLDAGAGALVLFGTVQVTMFAGALKSREHIPLARWAGAALALAGIFVLAAPGGSALPAVPILLMALAGLGWGLYSLAGRRVADPLAATARNFLLAAPVGLLVLFASGMSLPSAPGAALAVVSGAVTSGLGYALWYAILPRLGAARAAVAQLTVPVLAAAGGAALLAEAPGWRFALSATLVLGGVALASLQSGFTRR